MVSAGKHGCMRRGAHRRRWARGLAALVATIAMAGCGTAPVGGDAVAEPAAADAPLARPWRTVAGGFLATPGGVFGVPARPATGTYVKLLAPTAVALRGNDLLVVDSGTQRVWRADLALGTLTAVLGAPGLPGTAVALGADLSAWVLDARAGRLLRFARDGRLLQTLRANAFAPTPAAFAVLDGGAAVWLADALPAPLVELRALGAVVTPVQPQDQGAARIERAGALAATRDAVYVLDLDARVVHRLRRDGRIDGTLGAGVLVQPEAIAADRFGRVFVTEPGAGVIRVLRTQAPPDTIDARRLGVQQLGGIAVDERFLAIADRAAGQVVIVQLRDGATR